MLQKGNGERSIQNVLQTKRTLGWLAPHPSPTHPASFLLSSLWRFFFPAIMNHRFLLFYVMGKHNGVIHKQNKLCRTKHATKAHKRDRIPEQNLPHALDSWSSGFWVWRSWTRWSDGRGVPFAAWETGGRWEQQRVRQRQGEVGEADGGMLKGT